MEPQSEMDDLKWYAVYRCNHAMSSKCKIPSVTPEELAQVFEYRDGKVYWKKQTSQRMKAGTRAGHEKTSNYRQLKSFCLV